jgi:hypothetical protein
MRGEGQEIGYVKDLADWVNARLTEHGELDEAALMKAHSKKWFESYARRLVRMKALFSATRDSAIDRAVLEAQVPCS